MAVIISSSRKPVFDVSTSGTGDDSSPFPQLRALSLNDASTRALLETALREANASLDGADPGTGPMLRSAARTWSGRSSPPGPSAPR
jgi:hypothetical protein